jgi:hypothetical protein
MDQGLNPIAGRGLSLAIAAAALATLTSAGPALAQTPPFSRQEQAATGPLRALLGAWDLEQVGGVRRCTVILAGEGVAGGRKLRFPAICRRGLPLLTEAVAWTITPDGLPRFDRFSGQPLLAFARAGTGAGFEARLPDGTQYRLDPKSYPRLPPLREPGAAERAALAARAPTAVDPARAPSAESLPGRYSMMRQPNREACRIVLNAGPPAPTGRLPAAFEGNCSDTGLTIFDPAGWRYAAGRLSLIARKGHSVELVFENGQWRKDPAVGAPLLLKKLP